MANQFQDGYSFGKGVMDGAFAAKKTGRLAQLSQQAYGATGQDRLSALGQMEGVERGSGLAYGKEMQAQDDGKAKRWGGAARYFKSALESKNPAAIQGAWRAILPAMREMAQGQPVPEEFDLSQSDQAMQGVEQMIAASEGAGGGKQGELPTSAQEFALAQGNPAYMKYLEGRRNPQYGNVNGTPVVFGPDGFTPVPAAGGAPQGQPQPQQPGNGFQVIDVGNGEPPIDPRAVQAAAMNPGGDFIMGANGPVDSASGQAPQRQPQQYGAPDIYSQATPPIELSASIKSLWPALSPQQRKQAVEADAGVGLTAQQQEAKDRADRDEARKIAEEKAAAAGGGKTTDDAKKAAGYASRMEAALGAIKRYETTDKKANNPGLGIAALDMLPDSLGNYGKSDGRQNVEAAQLDALDAALTLNTGAAYTKEQLRGMAKAYFPQPGNSPEVVKEKALRLETLISTARVRAGSAAQPRADSGSPIPVRSAADYQTVPSGAEYMAPDGSIRRKK